MNNLSKKSIGVVVVDCTMSHYNGDPDVDDMGRMTIDGYGIISPQCLKHRLRSQIADPESVVWGYYKDKFNLSSDTHSIFESRLKGFNVKSAKDAVDQVKAFIKKNGEEGACKRFWDIRVFGTTALSEDKEANNKKLRFTRTGCVAVSPLLTLLPIEMVEQSLIKAYPLSDKYSKEEQCCPAPGAMKFARHGLFVGTYVINPMDAHKTGTTEEDIKLFKSLIVSSLSSTTSAGRSGLRVVQVLHADHDNPVGSFKEHDFIKACTPQIINSSLIDNNIPSTSISDYAFKTPEDVMNEIKDIKVIDLCRV